MYSQYSHIQLPNIKNNNIKTSIMQETQQKQNYLKCPKGRKAVVACVSDKCDHHSFCCKQPNCCQKIFKTKCKLIKIEDLQKLHQTSCNRLEFIYNQTIRFFQDVIKMVENQVNNFKQWSQKSSAIKKIFLQDDNDTKTGQDLAKILQDLNEYSQQYLQDVTAYLKLWDKNIRQLFAEMRLTLCDKGKKRVSSQTRIVNKIVNQQINKTFALTTRIVWKQSQKQALFDILNYIKGKNSVNLLYHAGSHDFSVKKFHQLCDGLPNSLVIIRNDKEKVYGGFTPLPWGKSKFQKFVCDQSLKTFVFSLSHKKKYLLKQHEKYYAIQWNSLFGPIFGRCNMIQVWDKANKQSSYWQHIPFSFKPAHGDWTNQMYEQIMGVPKYEEFKLLDWEVFQVIFD